MVQFPNNESAWRQIFKDHKILEKVKEHGFVDIDSKDINKYRQSRLMAKMDFRNDQPPIFKDNKLGILAIRNKTYRIGKFNPFITLPKQDFSGDIQKIDFRDKYLSLNPEMFLGTNQGLTESAILDGALLSGALNTVFGEKVDLTIRGRARSGEFDFSLDGIPFPINGVQVEVDGGYEGAETLNLVEAKGSYHDNISIRQLLYPQKMWEKKISYIKPVRSYVCYYDAPLIRIVPIRFDENKCWADGNGHAFRVEDNPKLDIFAIKEKENANLPVRGTPFPQADKLSRVIELFRKLSTLGEANNHISKEDLFKGIDVIPTRRQWDYYTAALRWFGLATVDSRHGTVYLTSLGVKFSSYSHAELIKELAKITFSEPVFHYCLHTSIEEPDAGLMKRFSIWRATGETVKRRLDTINAWIHYFKQQIDQ